MMHKLGRGIFQGETMACVMCNKVETNDPNSNSQWRAVQVDDVFYYVCPGHFPADGSPVAAFKKAYYGVLLQIVRIRTGQRNGRHTIQ